MTILQVAAIKEGSIVDGEGVRTVIFVAGCPFACHGCHNQEFQSIRYGKPFELEELREEIRKNAKLIDGLTISGGEPLFQYAALCAFLALIKTDSELQRLNIWVYTGYNFEQIPESIKQFVDVFIDGKYEAFRPKVQWRGSNNQRLFKKENGVFKEVK